MKRNIFAYILAEPRNVPLYDWIIVQNASVPDGVEYGRS